MDCAALSRLLADRVLAEGPGAPLSKKRRDHARGVAGLAAELCSRAGLDPERGRAAGLAHDMCKELPKPEVAALAAAFPGAPQSSILGAKVAHGPAAAVVLARDYGVEDAELLDAVAYHTLGRIGMGRLEMLVYCADKLEPGRKEIDPAFRESCLHLEPEPMTEAVARRLLAWRESQGLPAAPETLALIDWLSRRHSAP